MYGNEEEGKIYGPVAPVAISQYESEFKRLLILYNFAAPRSVLEIGTHYGGTLYHWINKGEYDAKFVSVDDYHLNRDKYESWKNEEQEIVSIQGKSQDDNIREKIKQEGPYQWIFIDGGHSYEEVAIDWITAQEVADKSRVTLIAFHDILPHPNSEVSLLWGAIREEFPSMELVEDYNQLGCGIGVIFL